MGGGGQSSTVDEAYNEGLLAIQQGQSEKGDTMFNMFMYGKEYNPHQEGYVDPNTGDFVAIGEAVESTPGDEATGHWETQTSGGSPNSSINPQTQERVWVSDVQPATQAPAGVEKTTRGAHEGYDFDNPPVSHASYLQDVVASQSALLPQQQEADEAELSASMAKSGLSETEAAEATRIINYGKEAGLAEAEIDAKLANAGLDAAQAKAAMKNVGIAGRAERQGYRTSIAESKDRRTAIAERAPVRTKMMKEALEGVDGQEWADRAQAGVEHGFKNTMDQYSRQIGSFGLDPSDDTGFIRTKAIEKAKAISGATTKAKADAEKESFGRLSVAMGGA